jgi:hypothetical protein
LKKIIPVIGLVVILSFSGWFFLINNQNQISPPKQEITQLERMGDDCTGIAEKAVIGMTPVVEFQKLELLSRKANVLKNCMADRGFYENPAWRKYTEPLAKAHASEQNISFDEAIENIRKIDMWVFEKQPQRPLYWLASKN